MSKKYVLYIDPKFFCDNSFMLASKLSCRNNCYVNSFIRFFFSIRCKFFDNAIILLIIIFIYYSRNICCNVHFCSFFSFGPLTVLKEEFIFLCI